MAARKTSNERGGASLFAHAAAQGRIDGNKAPLAERMRPRTVSEIVGQTHLLGQSAALLKSIEQDRLPSIILWGDPGAGKTTLAHVISLQTRSVFVPFNAVLGGVAELREVVNDAAERRNLEGKRTIVFVDEIHRFNRAQQDAFLPHVENGTITLIGATTENPSFAVNSALLSRARVFRLKALTTDQLRLLLQRALANEERGLGSSGVRASMEVLNEIADAARGDARRALNQLEALVAFAEQSGSGEVTLDLLRAFDDERLLLYDKSGEEHYNVTSALIKSLRGSDPDAAIYWMARMLEAGEDPLFVLRRLVIFASEDVGNADPRALEVAVNADQAFRRLGMPEGWYPISQACLYLASCPKSDGVKSAMLSARAAVKEHGALPVPLKLRNATTGLMKAEGYAEGYRYPHASTGHHVAGETYLPEALIGTRFYAPSGEGLEQHIRARLERLRGAGGETASDSASADGAGGGEPGSADRRK
ncbi:MAG TPA: replication-associated recombination protein A [Polyangiaceae bacterium]|nr:replication-associated recombination protein A [Polyangiaceae bacterium]